MRAVFPTFIWIGAGLFGGNGILGFSLFKINWPKGGAGGKNIFFKGLAGFFFTQIPYFPNALKNFFFSSRHSFLSPPKKNPPLLCVSFKTPQTPHVSLQHGTDFWALQTTTTQKPFLENLPICGQL